MDGQLVALLDDRPCLVDLRQVQRGIDTLGEQIEGDRDDVDVARTLAVAEQRPLDTLRAGHQAELGGRHRGATVVVRVDGEDGGVAKREVTAEPLDPVGVDVGRKLLHGGRQIHDHLLARGRPPLLGDALADLECVVELRVVEALRRVLEHDLRRCLRREPLAERRCRAPRGR